MINYIDKINNVQNIFIRKNGFNKTYLLSCFQNVLICSSTSYYKGWLTLFLFQRLHNNYAYLRQHCYQMLVYFATTVYPAKHIYTIAYKLFQQVIANDKFPFSLLYFLILYKFIDNPSSNYFIFSCKNVWLTFIYSHNAMFSVFVVMRIQFFRHGKRNDFVYRSLQKQNVASIFINIVSRSINGFIRIKINCGIL